MSEKRIISSLPPEEALQVKGEAMAASVTGVAFSDFDGRLIYVNPAFLRMWRCEEHEVLGHSATEFWQYPEDASTVISVLREQGGWSGELTARRSDGSLFDVQLSSSMIRDAAGQPMYMLGIFLDITERKRAEQALQERIKELRLIYLLSDLVQDPELGEQQFLQQAASILPSGWKYSDDACAAITVEGQEFSTDTFQDTPWQQRSGILVQGREVGAVVVGYLTPHPQEVDGPFLEEEHSLVYEVARRIGRLLERKRAEESMRHGEARYRGLFENSPIALFEQDFSAVKLRIDTLRGQGVADFRAFFEAWPEMVSECVSLVQSLDFNKAALELYGAKDKAELQVGLEDLVPAEARRLFIDELVWIAEGRTAFTWEGVNRKLNGELIDIRLHWAAEPDCEECLDRVLVSIEDITARKRAESDRQQSEARYRAVSELTSDFAFTFGLNPDGEWRTEWVTDAFGRITGFNPDEIDLRGSWLELVHPADRVAAAEAIQKLSIGIPATFEARLQTRDGRLRWVRVHSRPEWDAQRQCIVRISGAGQDINEVKRLEQEMIRTERLAAMGQVTAILAHEVQNPLQALQSNLELIGNFPLEPDEQDECLRMCQDEVNRLREMTRNVLSMSRIQPEAYRPVSIAEVWRKTQELLGQQLRSASIEVVADLPDDLPTVHGSAEQLAQVMINLTLNSIESMPSGGELRIGGRVSDNRLVVALANNGSPIPSDHLPRLFEPFFTTKPTGSGLGLFVSHMIVQQHGADLSVTNLPDGEGVCFTIALPLVGPSQLSTGGGVEAIQP